MSLSCGVQVVSKLPPAPEALQVLWDLPTRSTKMPNDLKKASPKNARIHFWLLLWKLPTRFKNTPDDLKWASHKRDGGVGRVMGYPPTHTHTFTVHFLNYLRRDIVIITKHGV